MRSAFKTAKGTFSSRDGLLLSFSYNRQHYLSECSPLAGFSVESYEDSLEYLQSESESLEHEIHEKLQWISSNFEENSLHIKDIEECFFNLDNVFNSNLENRPISVQFALDGILLQHICRLLANQDTHQVNSDNFDSTLPYLRTDSANSGLTNIKPSKDSSRIATQQILSRIPVNVTSNNIDQLTEFFDEGFRVFKLKVGVHTPSEIEFIFEIRKRFQNVDIRLDANGAWEVDEAKAILKKLQPHHIEYIEQPVSPENLIKNGDSLALTGIPIAADESIRSYTDAVTIINANAASVLIIKPAQIGKISDLIKIRDLAAENDLKVVITTSLDAGPGRQITALITSLFFNTGVAHGLATGYLFQEDIFPDSHLIRDGSYHPTVPYFSDSGILERHPSIKKII